MAMTKSERAQLSAVCERLALAESLRDLTLRHPPIVRPESGGGLETGIWWVNPYNLLHSVSAIPSAASCVGLGRRKGTYSHSTSETGESFAQGSGRFYASRRDALLALRDQVVERFSASLAAVDAELAKEA